MIEDTQTYLTSITQYALSLVSLPYKWGGDDTIDGFDCSGLVQEILSSYNQDPSGDQTADGLFHHFISNGLECTPTRGALCFYGNLKKIVHIGFCIDDLAMVEAGGGGRTTTSRSAAAKQNAFVRVRAIHSRKDFYCCIMPKYQFGKNAIS